MFVASYLFDCNGGAAYRIDFALPRLNGIENRKRVIGADVYRQGQTLTRLNRGDDLSDSR